MLFFCWFDVGSVLLWCCFLVESLLFPCWQNVVLLLVLPSKWHFCRMARYAFVVQTHLVRETLRPLMKTSLEYASAISFAAGAALERRRQIVTKKQCHGGTAWFPSPGLAGSQVLGSIPNKQKGTGIYRCPACEVYHEFGITKFTIVNFDKRLANYF